MYIQSNKLFHNFITKYQFHAHSLLTHSLTESVSHSLTQSISHSLRHSLTLTQSGTHSLTHPFSLTPSLTHSLTVLPPLTCAVPNHQSLTWSQTALAADMALDSLRALMMAEPRFCTVYIPSNRRERESVWIT